jgi:methyl-accepting chemotaxis protein WspA
MVRLSEGASRTTESLTEFNAATNHLSGAVSDLNDEVSRFTI